METQTQDGVEEDSAAFCSVLNVVIDSGMEDPTPLEPDEYNASLQDTVGRGKEEKPPQHQKVPVIRVFGPVLRRNAVNPPLQSKPRRSLTFGSTGSSNRLTFTTAFYVFQLLVCTFMERILI